jgi:hypothetical protein
MIAALFHLVKETRISDISRYVFSGATVRTEMPHALAQSNVSKSVMAENQFRVRCQATLRLVRHLGCLLRTECRCFAEAVHRLARSLVFRPRCWTDASSQPRGSSPPSALYSCGVGDEKKPGAGLEQHRASESEPLFRLYTRWNCAATRKWNRNGVASSNAPGSTTIRESKNRTRPLGDTPGYLHQLIKL